MFSLKTWSDGSAAHLTLYPDTRDRLHSHKNNLFLKFNRNSAKISLSCFDHGLLVLNSLHFCFNICKIPRQKLITFRQDDHLDGITIQLDGSPSLCFLVNNETLDSLMDLF